MCLLAGSRMALGREDAGRVLESRPEESRGEEAIPQHMREKPTGCRRCLGEAAAIALPRGVQAGFLLRGKAYRGISPFWECVESAGIIPGRLAKGLTPTVRRVQWDGPGEHCQVV